MAVREGGVFGRRPGPGAVPRGRPRDDVPAGTISHHRRHRRARRAGGPLAAPRRAARTTCCWSAVPWPAAPEPPNWRRNSARPDRGLRRLPTTTSSPRCWPNTRSTASCTPPRSSDDAVVEQLTPEQSRTGAAGQGRRGRQPARTGRRRGELHPVLLVRRVVRRRRVRATTPWQRLPRRPGAPPARPRAARAVRRLGPLVRRRHGRRRPRRGADEAARRRVGSTRRPR